MLASVKNIVRCDDCGTDYSTSAAACPNCGCPRKKKPRSKNVLLPLTAIFLTAAVIIGALAFIYFKNEEEIYYNDLCDAVDTMLNGTDNAEYAGNLLLAVWANSIHKKSSPSTDVYTMHDGIFYDDFNTALGNLYNDSRYSTGIDMIKSNQKTATSLMKKLKAPPAKYKDTYDALKEYYDCYLKFTNHVIRANGSYNSVSEDFNKLLLETDNAFDDLNLLLE